MRRTTTMAVAADGAPVVRHEAPGGPAADGLRHEALALHRARGAGVVALVGVHDTPGGGAVLTTRYVAGGTLADVARDHGERVALGALAGVAQALARLHEAGIVHGRLTADHVVGRDDEVALCGLREARLAEGSDRPDPTVDTAGFALLVEETCRADTDLSRRARRVAGGLTTSPPSTNLVVVATELAHLAGSRPGPAVAVRGRVLGPHRAVRRLASARRAVRSASPAGRAGAVAAVAVGIGLVGGLVLGGGDGGRAEPVAGATDAQEAPAARPRPTTSVPGGGEWPAPPVRVWPEPDEPAGPDASVGSPTSSTVAPAGVVEHDGVRYQVGAAGDLVVVGDWDCDGLVTPSVVRPLDGSVWTFTSWAADGEVVVARALGYAPSPVAAVTAPSPDGCDAIAVTTGDGREVVIDPG